MVLAQLEAYRINYFDCSNPQYLTRTNENKVCMDDKDMKAEEDLGLASLFEESQKEENHEDLKKQKKKKV